MEPFSPLATPATLRATLEKHGVAVLPGAVSEADCDAFVGAMGAWLRELIPGKAIDMDDEKTWANWRLLSPLHGGLIQHFGVGLHPACMELRTHPGVVAAFAALWGTDRLVGSKDGVYLGAPPERRGPRCHLQTEGNSWFHADQGSLRAGFQCAQAYVDCVGSGELDGTLSVLEGSHASHAALLAHFGRHEPNDWVHISPEEKAWLEARGHRWRTIVAPKGAMVFWDSRCFHMGTLPRPGRAAPQQWRVVLYVCYMPAERRTDKDYETSEKGMKELRCTTHWPAGVKLFPARPRTYGNEPVLARAPPPWTGTEHQRRLMGLKRWPGVALAPAAKRRRTALV
jgi:hypothetical protein